jgi:filamentous hemagglutinin
LAPGNPKAVVFQSALGYDTSNAGDLLTQLQDGVVNTPASPGVVDEFGSRFRVDIPVTGANGNTATVRTAFIYDPGSSVPRLVTAYVK